MTYSINIFHQQALVGTLLQDVQSGQLQVEYTPEWREKGFPLSPAITLDNNHHLMSVYNYLDNLLPEGNARQLLARSIAVSEKNIFPQIKALASDLSGAFIDGNKQPSKDDEPLFRIINDQEMIQRIDQKEHRGLLEWDNKPRLSVAGVQDKINVFINKGKDMGFGDGSLCSSHLLKFEKNQCQHLVLNEFFCMKLASSVNLNVAAVSFKRFGSHPALLVKRFDRVFFHDINRVHRIHIIDGCQALDLPGQYKYERNLGDNRDVQHIRDGVNLADLFAFCRQTSEPVKNQYALLHWVLFNLFINNYDSHGKNISFVWEKNKSYVAPAYDLVNVSMFSGFKHTLAMAMAIGDEFNPNNIHAYQLADFAECCRLNKTLVMDTLMTLGKKVLDALDKMNIEDIKGFDSKPNKEEQDYWHALKDNISTRTKHLIAQAPDIPTTNV